MLKTMQSFSVTTRPDTLKKLDELAEKYNAKRTQVARALLMMALRDKEIVQKAMDIL